MPHDPREAGAAAQRRQGRKRGWEGRLGRGSMQIQTQIGNKKLSMSVKCPSYGVRPSKFK